MQAIAPIAAIGDRHHRAVADPEQGLQHALGVVHRLDGLAQHHAFEGAAGIVAELALGIALDHRQPLIEAGGDAVAVDLDAARIDALGVGEMVEKGVVEVAPLAFMRGRTLSKAFVILDEAQNTTPIQMKMLLTRLGPQAKCVVTGDITQIDLPRGTVSGLKDAVRVLQGIRDISVIHFTKEDVIRHHLVAQIVEAYEEAEQADDN